MPTNNYYYSYDSHNVTTTTTNNVYSSNTYSSTDSHNTTTNTYVYAPVDNHSTTTSTTVYAPVDSHNTTGDTTTIDSHDTTNTSLIGGGVLDGSLNNILAGANLLNIGSLLSGNTFGDVLSGNQLLSPTVNVGDINLGVDHVVSDVLNPNILNSVDIGNVLSPTLTANLLDGISATVGDVLSPGNLLSNIGVSDVLSGGNISGITANVLPVAGDVLSHVNVADLSHLTANVGDVLPVAAGVSDLLNVENIGNVTANVLPTASDVLSHINVTPTVGDIVSHIANVDSSIVAPVTDVLSNITGGPVGIAAPIAVDALSHIADFGNISGGIGNLVANIASSAAGGDFANFLHAATSLDLSQVGAVVQAQPLDTLASHIDLDHLASNPLLFSGDHHIDLPIDLHHV